MMYLIGHNDLSSESSESLPVTGIKLDDIIEVKLSREFELKTCTGRVIEVTESKIKLDCSCQYIAVTHELKLSNLIDIRVVKSA